MKQYFPSKDDAEDFRRLSSTNGRMLDVILSNTVASIPLEASGSSNYHGSILSVIEAGVIGSEKEITKLHAIIDCGALLTGRKNNRDVAFEILQKIPHNFKGVIFFDKERHDDWAILERVRPSFSDLRS